MIDSYVSQLNDIHQFQSCVLPAGYVESLDLFTYTHSNELLDRMSNGRPLANYKMLERDLEDAEKTWNIPIWKSSIVALDNNQIKIGSHDANHKDTMVCSTMYQTIDVK